MYAGLKLQRNKTHTNISVYALGNTSTESYPVLQVVNFFGNYRSLASNRFKEKIVRIESWEWIHFDLQTYVVGKKDCSFVFYPLLFIDDKVNNSLTCRVIPRVFEG